MQTVCETDMFQGALTEPFSFSALSYSIGSKPPSAYLGLFFFQIEAYREYILPISASDVKSIQFSSVHTFADQCAHITIQALHRDDNILTEPAD